MNLFNLMATLGLDDSAYRTGIQSVQNQTKKTVAELSSEYSKASKSVAELTRRYNESVAKTGKTSSETKNLKNMLAQAEAQLKTTTTALKAAQNGMEGFGQKTDSAGDSMASAMTKAQLLVSVVQKVTSAAVTFGKKILETGIDYNAQLETYQTALTNMMGSAEKASAFMKQIQQDAARTPFSTDSLVAANQFLLSAGENAEYSRKTILALGDAVKATGGGDAELQRMAQNLQQVANVGKASSVDIKQFAFAGINIYQVLADYTGKSVQEVQSMTITYDVLTKALQAAAEEGGRYYNSMSTQSQTLSGRMTTLQDNASQLAAALTKDLADAYGQLITKANDLAVAMKDGWETDGFQGMMSAAAQAVPELEGVANALKWIETNSDVLIPVLTTLGTAFLYAKAYAGAQGLLGAITALLNPTNLIIAGLGLFAGALVTAYTQCEPFRNAVNGAFSNLESVAGGAIDWTVGKIHTLISAVAGAIAALNALKNGEGLEAAKNAYTNAYQSKQQSYNTRQWNSDHSNMEWDENDGWVPKGSSGGDSGNGTSRPDAFSPTGTESGLTGGSGGSSSSKSKGTVKKTVLSAVTDAATSYSTNEYGRVTTATTELTEHIKDSTGKVYDQLTRTVTESGKEMVNGVVKNYKLVTKTVTDENGKATTTTQKTYEDASQSLLSTLTATAKKLVNGVSTVTQTTTEKYADNSEHIKQIVTETGERIVNGALETYTRVRTIEDGYETNSKETSEAVVSQYNTLLSAYNAAAQRVDQLRDAYNESAASTGENSEQTQRLSALLVEAEDDLSDAKTAWTDYQKTTNRAYVVTKNFADFLKKSNSAFSDFGNSLSGMGDFFDSQLLQNAGDFFTTITDGVDKVINFATSTAALVTTLQELRTSIDAINATGGISGTLSGIGKLIGVGGTAAAGGAAASATGAAATGAATEAAAAGGTAAAGGGLAALGLTVPELGLIIAGVLGVAAVGYGIYKWFTKDKDKTATSTTPTYKDIQDAYWYGNERAFAGYDYRTDPYTFNPNNSAMLAYQTKVQAQLEKLYGVVEQYLPQAGSGVLAVDGEELGRIISPSVNRSLGDLAVLDERGN